MSIVEGSLRKRISLPATAIVIVYMRNKELETLDEIERQGLSMA